TIRRTGGWNTGSVSRAAGLPDRPIFPSDAALGLMNSTLFRRKEQSGERNQRAFWRKERADWRTKSCFGGRSGQFNEPSALSAERSSPIGGRKTVSAQGAAG